MAKRKKDKNDPESGDDTFGLDIDFQDALERFLNVDIKEVNESSKAVEQDKTRQNGSKRQRRQKGQK